MNNEYKKNRLVNNYGRLHKCSTPSTTRSVDGVVYPRYGETDKYMTNYNQLGLYNQIMNIQAQNYQDYLESGMGPY